MFTVEIGKKVLGFPIARTSGEPEIKERLVMGARVNKTTGELIYVFDNEELPAYAVADTMEEAEAKRAAFMEYRDQLNAKMDDIETFALGFQASISHPEILVELTAMKEAKDDNK